MIGLRRSRHGVGILADELNQFAIAVETYATRNMLSAEARLNDKEATRHRALFDAARRMRDRIAELIPS